MKNIKQLYLYAKSQLKSFGIECPESEALRLCEHFFGFSGRTGLLICSDDTPDAQKCESFLTAVEQRSHRPLQYILGTWQFGGMELSVGEGVLVPREDTTALVDSAVKMLDGINKPKVLDLCAGSGAVALGILEQIPSARLVCVELSDDALPYLRENIKKYGRGQVQILKGDVLDTPPNDLERNSFDAIVSNPPYIPTDDIDGLSPDVKREPFMALDGGRDGLNFYRSICENWLCLLKHGGGLAVEIGIDQSDDVERIFVRSNLTDISLNHDINGKVRAINGTFRKNRS
ncbi:MAG: peptide chain release factor N(5)-glutamine methyltransferase [Clostridia bacterium]|nr:peptide chain release factor N(5)-glutamine methyltransferase [Clostridia bacterium]